MAVGALALRAFGPQRKPRNFLQWYPPMPDVRLTLRGAAAIFRPGRKGTEHIL
jgi:hypothetical protein